MRSCLPCYFNSTIFLVYFKGIGTCVVCTYRTGKIIIIFLFFYSKGLILNEHIPTGTVVGRWVPLPASILPLQSCTYGDRYHIGIIYQNVFGFCFVRTATARLRCILPYSPPAPAWWTYCCLRSSFTLSSPPPPINQSINQKYVGSRPFLHGHFHATRSSLHRY